VTDTLTVQVTRDPGGLRFTMPAFPDWAATASGAHEIARALDAAWTEQQIAAYARSRGTVRDVQAFDDRLDHTRRPTRLLHSVQDPAPEPRPQLLARVQRREAEEAAQRRIITYGAEELQRAQLWTINYDGTWTSPYGRVFKATSEHVRRISKILAEHGEEPTPTELRAKLAPVNDAADEPEPTSRRRQRLALRAVPLAEQERMPLPDAVEA
jgi:hypothetical protein